MYVFNLTLCEYFKIRLGHTPPEAGPFHGIGCIMGGGNTLSTRRYTDIQ